MSELWQRGDYTISTDRSRLNIDLIHDFISNHSYWGKGRAREVVIRSIENSMSFGVYHGDEQVGFARIVTDYATFAWVADVFIVPEHRERGLSKWLLVYSAICMICSCAGIVYNQEASPAPPIVVEVDLNATPAKPVVSRRHDLLRPGHVRFRDQPNRSSDGHADAIPCFLRPR